MSATPTPITLAFVESRPDAAARVLDGLDATAAAAFLGAIPARLAAPLAARMHPDAAAVALSTMEPSQSAALVRAMPHLDGLSILRLVPPSARQAVYDRLPSRMVSHIDRSLRYPPGTVGAWMDHSIAPFRATSRVSDALRYLRGGASEHLTHVFVLGPGGHLEGTVSVVRLLAADADPTLRQLLDRPVEPLSNRALLSEVAGHRGWDQHAVLPVVGRKGNVLGGLSRASLRRGLAQSAREPQAQVHARLASHLLAALLVTLSGLFETLLGKRRA